MRSFRVESVPTDAHTATNKVYFNPKDIPFCGKYINIKEFIYSTAEDPRVNIGSIALNGIQRKCIKVSTMANDIIDIKSGGIDISDKNININTCTSIHIQLEYITATKRGGAVDVVEIIKYIGHQFNNQCFCEGQKLAIVLDSMSKYIGTVMGVKVENDDLNNNNNNNNNKSSLLPVLFTPNSTQVIISALDKCEITLNNIPDSQLDAMQPNIVQKFDLENLGIGGLREEFGQVFRRAFASRIFPQSVVKRLGIKHVKGVLLHGPPGTGKTLIARKIGEILNCRPPRIVNGPDILDKFVGGTEKNVRNLFADAEAEQAAKGEQSQLHLIIFDEFDSICKHRGTTRDNTGVADNVVNQLLAKIDGVDSLNNVLLIGMTNRKDLIDDAILRPGRFEVHVEIGLPDENGRLEVFRIHTREMRENKTMADDVDIGILSRNTKNFSGSEIEGVVRSATSYALNRHIDFENPSETIDAANIKIEMRDFISALEEVKPAFGASKDECEIIMSNGIIDYGSEWRNILEKATSAINRIRSSSKISQISIMLEGCVGSGKSAFAAHLAMQSEFPYVKYISNNNLVSYSEIQKSAIIRKAFDDAHKSKLSVVVLDDIERLIEYSHLGARYSNILLQTLLVLIRRPPPIGKKIIVIGTSSLDINILEELEISSCFSISLHISPAESINFSIVAKEIGLKFKSEEDERGIVSMCIRAPIQRLLLSLQMSADDNNIISLLGFEQAVGSIIGGGIIN